MNIKALVAALSLATFFVVAGDGSASAQTAPAAAPANVVVQPGDSLSKIASAHQTTYVRLYDANTQIADPDVIHPGESVRIPASDEQLASRPMPANAPAPAAPAPKPVAKEQAAPRKAVTRTAKPAPRAVVASGDVWSRLAQCESGGNPAINTGNGYYGAYQFSASTWKSVGGSGLPHQASLEEQTARAQMLQARSGWGQWPACSAKLGLR